MTWSIPRTPTYPKSGVPTTLNHPPDLTEAIHISNVLEPDPYSREIAEEDFRAHA